LEVAQLEIQSARVLLTSLLDRIEPGPISGKSQLRGVISDQELAALRFALEQLGGPVSPPVKALAPMKLLSRALNLDGPESPEIRLCLDFGTAMSKAFAVRLERDGKLTLIPLPLGQRAGEPEALHSVSSSLWIDADGKVFVGSSAVSRGQPFGNRRREDSLKRFITLPNAGTDLDAKALPLAVNPISDIAFTQEEALTLYFGYLADLASSALEEQGFSRYVRRRFAVPCWASDRREWGEELLRNLLSRAVIVADHFHDRWKAGIPLAEVKAVLSEIKRLRNLPLSLLEQGISEPVAAGSSFLNLEEQISRKLLMVIDVGAGTSDFALFILTMPRGADSSQYVFRPLATAALSQAGDQLDSILIDTVLSNARLHHADAQYDPVRAELQARIRGIKERLCRGGGVTETLSNGIPFTFTRDEFFALSRVQEFGSLLEQKFNEVVSLVDPSYFNLLGPLEPLEVLLTGGGASLDVVKQLPPGRFACGTG
jgi:molecular chaperone HscA